MEPVTKLRIDGRQPKQARPLISELGGIIAADGSASLQQGNTHVMAAVYGPKPARQSSREHPTKAVLTLAVRPAGGPPGPPERELSAWLHDVLIGCIDVKAAPRCEVELTLHVLHDDGAVRAVALNAAMAALMHARVPCIGIAAAATVCQLRVPLHRVLPGSLAVDAQIPQTLEAATPSDSEAPNGPGPCVMDPVAQEESDASVVYTGVYALSTLGQTPIASHCVGMCVAAARADGMLRAWPHSKRRDCMSPQVALQWPPYQN